MALIETLYDPFDGTTLNAALWTEVPDAGITFSIHDGVAEWVRIGTTGVTAAAVAAVDLYSLTDSSLTLTLTATAGGGSVGPLLQFLDSTGSQSFSLYGNYPTAGFWLLNWWNPAGTGTSITTVVFDPAVTQYRFTGSSAGHLIFESTVDGSSWTELLDTGAPVYSMDELRPRIGAVFNADGASTMTLAQVGELPSAAVTKTAIGRWDLGGPTTTGGAARWDLGGGVTSSALGRWDVAPLISAVSAQWDLAGVVSRTAVGRWDVEPAPPVEWDGQTSEAEAAAGAGSFTVEAGYWLTGATASATAAAGSGALELGAGPPVWVGATAEAIGTANPGAFLTGVQVVGDPFALPVVLSGLSGVASAPMGSATLQAGEPYTHGASRTWWFHYTAPVPGVLTIISTNTTAHWIDVYNGEDLAGLELLDTFARATDGTSLSVEVSSEDYYIRVASTASVTLALTYDLLATVGALVLENRTPTLVDTPEVIRVGVLGAFAGEDVLFEWRPPPSEWIPADITRPIELSTVQADETGTILSAGIPLSEVSAGTHTIYATGLSSGYTDTATVVVENDPPELEVEVADEEPPSFVVGRWTLNDTSPSGLGEYEFPRNPASMSTPHAPRTILAEHTTAASGQAVLWEGGLVATDWQFAGYVDTESFYYTLVAYAGLNYKFWLTDHRGRQWKVSFYGLDMVPVKNADKPWAHNYTIQCHIYGQAVI